MNSGGAEPQLQCNADGTIVWANAAMGDLAQTPVDDLLGQRWEDVSGIPCPTTGCPTEGVIGGKWVEWRARAEPTMGYLAIIGRIIAVGACALLILFSQPSVERRFKEPASAPSGEHEPRNIGRIHQTAIDNEGMQSFDDFPGVVNPRGASWIMAHSRNPS